MLTLADWLWAIPVFGVIILVHELGHFTAAKIFGIRVEEFAIGFGPSLASVRLGETRYSLRALLVLGGFVRMSGMEDGSLTDPRGFSSKPAWQRMVTIAAGPAMNFLLATLLFALLVGLKGHMEITNRVAGVVPGSPAQAAGIVAGDRIVAIDGQPVQYFSQLARIIRESGGRRLQLTVEGPRGTRAVEVAPALEGGRWIIGVEPDPNPVYIPVSPVGALRDGVQLTWLVTQGMFGAVGRWLTGQEQPQVLGPVGITRTVAQASQEGIDILVGLAGQLSVNIGIINLFPFPALDGSRLLFLGVEAARGRRMNPHRENMIHFVGFVLLLGLMFALTWAELTH